MKESNIDYRPAARRLKELGSLVDLINEVCWVLGNSLQTTLSRDEVKIMTSWVDTDGHLKSVVRRDSGGAHPDVENGPRESDVTDELHRYSYFLIDLSSGQGLPDVVYEITPNGNVKIGWEDCDGSWYLDGDDAGVPS